MSWAEMERIGVDPAGIRIMVPKQSHYNLMVEGLTPAQANVLKQEMLSIGGEAAVARGAASCSVSSTGAIVSGTLRQLTLLIEKLNCQSFRLPDVAASLKEALDSSLKGQTLIKGGKRDWQAGKRTLLMGILNITPDSFSDGGRFFDEVRAVERALEMVEQGADWIDVGAESTRPGAEPVDAKEELRRVLPAVEALSKKGVTVSVDTMKAGVARACLEAGAEIINDVSALGDSSMARVCAEFKCPVILMHMRGTPRTMQLEVGYKDLISEVYGYLLERLAYAKAEGIDDEATIVDPGIGFGKSLEGNLEIIRRLSEFKSLGRPILVGASRKSFIGKALNDAGMEKRLPGTLAASVIAATNGASIIRAHDVKEARSALDLADAVRAGA